METFLGIRFKARAKKKQAAEQQVDQKQPEPAKYRRVPVSVQTAEYGLIIAIAGQKYPQCGSQKRIHKGHQAGYKDKLGHGAEENIRPCKAVLHQHPEIFFHLQDTDDADKDDGIKLQTVYVPDLRGQKKNDAGYSRDDTGQRQVKYPDVLEGSFTFVSDHCK
jgi:hypothetical protein